MNIMIQRAFVSIMVLAATAALAIGQDSTLPGSTPPAAEPAFGTAPQEVRAEAELRSKENERGGAPGQRVIVANDAAGDPVALTYKYYNKPGARKSPADRPALIATQPMTPQIRAEWAEDLTIMERLLRQCLSRTSDALPKPILAMGIRVTMSENDRPMYIEGGGALFSFGINMPLAAGNVPAGGSPAPKTVSLWDRAKREMNGEDVGTKVWLDVTYDVFVATVKFDSAKLDALIHAIVTTLPEASNFRHLKADEFVIVTITGIDDAGALVRLNLKAKKSDIDAAASGQLKPEEFKRRVPWKVG